MSPEGKTYFTSELDGLLVGQRKNLVSLGPNVGLVLQYHTRRASWDGSFRHIQLCGLSTALQRTAGSSVLWHPLR